VESYFGEGKLTMLICPIFALLRLERSSFAFTIWAINLVSRVSLLPRPGKEKTGDPGTKVD